MNSGKIFWLMVVALAAGFFAFLVFGIAVTPANAAVQQPQAQTQQPSGTSGQLQAGAQPAAVKNGVQEVQLYVEGGTYYLNPPSVKKGIPVKIVADMNRLPGCSRAVVIPDFGISKFLSSSDNVIEFTPDKSGTFSIRCAMNMYRGTIVVEDASGTVAKLSGDSPKAAPAPGVSVAASTGTAPAGSSCGVGGGCGCGGGI